MLAQLDHLDQLALILLARLDPLLAQIDHLLLFLVLLLQIPIACLR